MSEPRFKVGDVVADSYGLIGRIVSVHAEGLPYRIEEPNGTVAGYTEYPNMRLETTPEEPVSTPKAPEDSSPVQHDPVNHPKHYVSHPSGIECIQVTEHMGFNLGNVIKYVWRADLKADALEDLRKAVWYIEREIQKREKA